MSGNEFALPDELDQPLGNLVLAGRASGDLPRYRAGRHADREGRVWGHENAFLRLRLSARSAFRKQTFAGTCGNEEDAPISDIMISGVDWSSSVPRVHIDEKDPVMGDDFILCLGDDFLLRPRRAAVVGRTGPLLIIDRSVREAPFK